MPKASSYHQLIPLMTLIVLMSSGELFAQTPEAAVIAPPEAVPAEAPAAPAQTQEKPLYNSTAERDNGLLVAANPGETQWLETANEKFVALYKAGETRKTKGALLILHAPELPQLWPAPLENLRRNLPLYGWETMTVPLPQKYSTKTPERTPQNLATVVADPTTSSAASSESSVSAAASSTTALSEATNQAQITPLPRAQLMTERVSAALAHLNKNGQLNVVVLVDNSSAPDSLAGIWAKMNQGTGKSNMEGQAQALILVNLQSQEPLTQTQLGAIFAAPNLPIMDVFFDRDNQYQANIRRLHRAEAMRKNVKYYQQVILPPEHFMTIDDKQSFWLEKVRGFMEKKAEGVELTK